MRTGLDSVCYGRIGRFLLLREFRVYYLSLRSQSHQFFVHKWYIYNFSSYFLFNFNFIVLYVHCGLWCENFGYLYVCNIKKFVVLEFIAWFVLFSLV